MSPFMLTSHLFAFLFCLSKKERKKTPEKDNTAFSGGFSNLAFVVLW
jgi:hypothetical protein